MNCSVWCLKKLTPRIFFLQLQYTDRANFMEAGGNFDNVSIYRIISPTDKGESIYGCLCICVFFVFGRENTRETSTLCEPRLVYKVHR